MAGLSLEEFMGGGQPAAVPAAPATDAWSAVGYPGARISPAQKQEAERKARYVQEQVEGQGVGIPTYKVVEGAKPPPNAGMSLEEFTGAPAPAALAGGKDPFAQSKPEIALEVLRDTTIRAVRGAGGELGNIADMILGLTLGAPASLATATIAGLQHEVSGGSVGVPFQGRRSVPGRPEGDPAGFASTGGGAATGLIRQQRPGREYVPAQPREYTAFTAGREFGGELAEKYASPFRQLFDMLGKRELYDESKTAEVMGKFGELLDEAGVEVEQATGGRVGRDAVPMFVETVMTAMIGKLRRSPGAIDPQMQKTLRQHAEKLKKEAETELAGDWRGPGEAGDVATRIHPGVAQPVQQQINQLLGIQTPAMRAAEVRKRRAEVKKAFEEPAPGSDYVDIAESQFRADERMQRSAEMEGRYPAQQETPPAGTAYEVGSAPAPERVSDAAVLRILRKPGFERTAEDLLTLRKARQEGSARPEVLGLLAAAGITGAALSDDDLRRAAIDRTSEIASALLDSPTALAAGATAVGAVLPFLGRGAGLQPRGPGGRQLGAVKGPGGMWHPEAVESLAAPLKDKLEGVGAREGHRIYDTHDAELSPSLLAMRQWSDKSVRNYLNRYAGTARDPLKDVEIPFREGTARWEELMDATIQAKEFRTPDNNPGGYYPPLSVIEREAGIRSGELVWNFGERNYPGYTTTSPEGNAITSYLSHVGDYLRQNVKPEKLPQYDLVRAVRETYQNDLRVARDMAKAAADETVGLPVYKAYPDGFRWVELKLPEKLTEEQRKRVKLTGYPGEPDAYTALNADGKPIMNNYTALEASGATPERAWLAGQLAREGNQMGHCVGGYCESVASGEQRILSLRDPKGLSHVTVEIEPPPGPAAVSVWDKIWPKTYDRLSPELQAKMDAAANNKRYPTPGWVKKFEPEAWEKYLEIYNTEFLGSIAQIKGKQNRAPNSTYLPYVQDLVKEGKWGEVGDLGNTGLYQYKNRYLTQDEVAAEAIKAGRERGYSEEMLTRLAADPQDAIATLRAMDDTPGRYPPRGQRGAADPRLIQGLGAISLGGLIGSWYADDPLDGALLGGLAGLALQLPGAKERWKAIGKGADYIAGMPSTRLLNLGLDSLHKRVIGADQAILTNTRNVLDRLVPWLRESANLPKGEKGALDRALFAEDPKAISAVYAGKPGLVAAWREVQNVLRELGEKAQGLGRFKDYSADYFPRRVKDYEGLMKKIDSPIRDRISKAILDAEKTAPRRGAALSDAERDAIVNRELRNAYRPTGSQPDYAKARKIREVTEELQPFYYPPQMSLYITVREVVRDMEMAQLFGKDLVQTEKAGRQYINVDASIGNLVGRELAEGRLTPEQVREVESIMRSRFGPGEQAASKLIAELKSIGYMGTIGNPLSAITQLGDPLLAIFGHGPRATIAATARSLTGTRRLTTKDFGLADHIAEEIAAGAGVERSMRATQRAAVATGAAIGATAGYALGEDPWAAVVGGVVGSYVSMVGMIGAAQSLNKIFRHSGFSQIDRFGKDIHLNAALSKYERLARTPAGIAQIQKKYGAAYGEKFPELVRDLQGLSNGRGAEIPETVRALAFMELSRFQPITKWEVPQAYHDMPNGRIVYMLKTFMLKQADVIRRDAYNQIKKGNVAEGMKNLTAFATVLGFAGAAPDLIKDFMMGQDVDITAGDVAANMLKTFGFSQYVMDKMAKGETVSAPAGALMPPYQMMERIISADPKAVNHIPIVGRLYYNWEMGGKEETEIRKGREEKRETGREPNLSPAARAYQRRKEAERRRKERLGDRR